MMRHQWTVTVQDPALSVAYVVIYCMLYNRGSQTFEATTFKTTLHIVDLEICFYYLQNTYICSFNQ